jgi:thiamine pyrophosphate-dependent acetolactate synthase large subunit-like protein
MLRDDALRAICAAVGRVGGALFVGNGNNARAVHALADAPWVFYMLGSMGQCAPLAAGFSRFGGRPVAAVEGDGNTVMGLSGLPVVVAAARPPFLHIVLDNGSYETTGRQRVLAPESLFLRAAEGAGYAWVRDVASAEELREALAAGLTGGDIGFVRVCTEPEMGPMYPRVRYAPAEIPPRFIAAFGAASMADLTGGKTG